MLRAWNAGPEPCRWPITWRTGSSLSPAWLLVGVKSTDLHSGMRAYSRRLIQEVEVDPNGPALPVDLLLKPVLRGFRFREVFIPYGERIGETTLAALVFHSLDLPPHPPPGLLPPHSRPQTKPNEKHDFGRLTNRSSCAQSLKHDQS